jgi:deoxyhypusine monooxygenase
MSEYDTLRDVLLNTNAALTKRFQALFALRSLGTKQAIDIIGAAFQDSSALLGHEVAYVLGQIGSVDALPALEGVLKDTSMHPMTRHEAAEAMGAISSVDSLPLLKQYRDAPTENVAVRETCEIAVQKIEWDHGLGQAERTQKRCVFRDLRRFLPTFGLAYTTQ